MDRNWRVVMMVAKSNAPNSRMVYKMHSCPHVDATQEQGRPVAHTHARKRTLTHSLTYLLTSPSLESRRRSTKV